MENILKTGRGGESVTYIGIGDFVPSDVNNYETESYEELVASIRTFGLQTPLTVIGPNADGKYEVLSGERRYLACRKLCEEGNEGLGKLPAYIIGGADMGKQEKQLRIEISNLDIREGVDTNMHRMNVVRLIMDMTEGTDITREGFNKLLDEYLKVSPRYRRCYKSIVDKGIPELQKMVEENKIPVTMAGWVSSQGKEGQAEIVKNIDEGQKPDEAIGAYREEHGILPKGDERRQKEIRDSYASAFDADAISDEEARIIEGYYDDYDGVKGGRPGSSHINENADDFLDLQGDMDDIFKSFRHSIGDVDPAIDTSGRLKGMAAEAREDAEHKKAVTLATVKKWLEKIIDNGECSKEEEPLIELCKTIAEMF